MKDIARKQINPVRSTTHNTIKAQQRSTAEELPDRSGKPGEGFVCWGCAGLVADSRNNR